MEEIKNDLEVKSEVNVLDFDLESDLTEDQIHERFNMRRKLNDKECGNDGKTSPISEKDLSFPISSLSNIFYDDRYKIIMCLPPKAGTTNWQRVLAVLKFNGTVEPSYFGQGTHYGDRNIYNVIKRFPGLSRKLGHGMQLKELNLYQFSTSHLEIGGQISPRQ